MPGYIRFGVAPNGSPALDSAPAVERRSADDNPRATQHLAMADVAGMDCALGNGDYRRPEGKPRRAPPGAWLGGRCLAVCGFRIARHRHAAASTSGAERAS